LDSNSSNCRAAPRDNIAYSEEHLWGGGVVAWGNSNGRWKEACRAKTCMPRERYRKELLTRKTKTKFAQEKSYDTIQYTREPARMILPDIDKPRL
jgi:hypothetical protein